MSYAWIINVVVILSHCVARAQCMTIENNGYTGVVVAISDDVPEDTGILDRINDIFTEASRALYTATRSRAYLEEVTVLIPPSWSDNAIYTAASAETFGNADVIVQNTDGQDAVHVLRPRQDCGTVDPDAKMFITTDRIYEGSLDSWARVLVHEWAHLRYGVYDEYPMAGQARFYASDFGAIEAVRCSAAITGRTENSVTGGRCGFENNLPEADCVYVEDADQDRTGFASVMYKPALQEIGMFCDDADSAESEAVTHNAAAPNKHNLACDGRSVWSVITQHQDFLGVNEARVVGSAAPRVTFKRQQTSRTVLVLDVSGSMQAESRIIRLGQACRTFISNTVQDGVQLGIVWFSDIASAEKDLTVVGDATRPELLAKVPTTTGGATSIGAGVLEAVEMLRTDDTCGGKIIVFTDGMENTAPYLADVEQTVFDCGITVHAVAISGDAETTLDNIVTMTGGQMFLSYAADQSNAITDALQSIGQINLPPSQQVFTIASLVRPLLQPGEAYIDTVHLDATLARSCMFVFEYTGSDVTAGVSLPSGVAFDVSSAIVIHDTLFRAYTFSIPDDVFEAGEWTFSVSNPTGSSMNVGITVTSMTTTVETATYMTQVHWTPSSVQSASQGLANVLQIVATVSLGSIPIVGADVRAMVDTPGGAVTQVVLQDNGVGCDLEAGDGIYTEYFTDSQLDVSGRYGLQVQCLGNDQSVANFNDVLGETADDLGNTGAQQDPVSTGPFQRTQIGSSFTLPENFVVATGAYPPAQITDLVVTAAYPANNSVTLQWTAVGDQLMNGAADSYDLRYSTSFQQMSLDFNGQDRVLSADVASGDDLNSPLRAYTRQSVTITVPESGDLSYVFAIKAIGTSGDAGPISNIATVSMAALGDEGDDGDNSDDSLGVPVIISIATIGAMFVVTLLLLSVVRMQSVLRARHESKHASREQLYAKQPSPYPSKSPMQYPQPNPYSTMNTMQYPASVPSAMPYWMGPRY